MPVPAHNRITFSGIFGQVATPAEIWSWRLTTGPLVFSSLEDREAYATDCRELYTQHIAPLMTSDVVLTRTRVSQHAAGGLTTTTDDGGYHQADDETTVPGINSGSARVPLQTALCVSLETTRAGATGKGRVFLPAVHRTVQANTFTLADGVSAAYAGALASVITALNGMTIVGGVGDGDVVVASSKGYLSRVVATNCGDVLDTMRSRRNALPEKRARQVV